MISARGPIASRIATGAAGLLALALAAAPLSAQQTGAVSGTVVDGSNMQPLDGAQVTVQGTGLGTISSADGQFTIRGVPTGSRTIRVQFVGYQTASRSVNVSAGQTANVRFELAVSAVDMEEIIVTGQGGEVERRKLGVDVASVDATEPRRSRARSR